MATTYIQRMTHTTDSKKDGHSWRWLALVAMLLAAQTLAAQTLQAFHGEVEEAYNFWLYTPPATAEDSVAQLLEGSSSRKPLIVFLHGQSLCGRNLDRVRRYGPLNALEMGMKIDAYVLAPQNPGGSWNPRRVIRLVDWASAHAAVDTNRVYLIGMSLGGFGTLDVAATYPDRFAAAMALCGGSTLNDLCGLNRLPLWIMHGTADRAVGIGQSQRVVDAMKQCDSAQRLIWTPVHGADHGRLARVFYLHDTYSWLFAHSLSDSARAVDRSFAIDNASLDGNIYRAVRADGGRVRVVGTPGKASATTDDAGYYKVRKGDTLSGIARRHGTSVAALCRLNGIRETDLLRIGRRLRVR